MIVHDSDRSLEFARFRWTGQDRTPQRIGLRPVPSGERLHWCPRSQTGTILYEESAAMDAVTQTPSGLATIAAQDVHCCQADH